MIIKVDNSTNELEITASREGDYLSYKNEPIKATWTYYFTQDETNRFFVNLPYNADYRAKINTILPNDTNIDFSKNIKGLHDFLKPLWKILKNGNYELKFYRNSKELFKRNMRFNGEWKNYYDPLEIFFANHTTDITKLDVIQTQYKIKWRKGEHISENNLEKLLNNTTSFDYDEDMLYFHSTFPKDKIDLNRVAYYENEIKKGKRPFATLISSYFHYVGLLPSYYVLDGHHKLMAYKNLKIYPPLAICAYIDSSDFDLSQLANVLYPWHIEYIIENKERPDKIAFFNKIASNKSSNLHAFLKNGKFEEVHIDRNEKYEFNYKNSSLDGVQKTWYNDNGQLKSIRYYSNGKAIGIWKYYFKSGQIQAIRPYNDNHQIHGIAVSYHDNGKKHDEEEYENGRHKDGIYNTWHKNGLKEFEVIYKKGRIVEQKSWNSYGKMYSHRKMNKESKRLEEISDNEKKHPIDTLSAERTTIIQTIRKYLNNKLKK
jgi:antitoxin component YwqK of YwqJK toxin-antitoxin module